MNVIKIIDFCVLCNVFSHLNDSNLAVFSQVRVSVNCFAVWRFKLE